MRTANKKKALLATSLASASLVGVLLVGGVAFAQTTSGANGGLAQAIASKFNLNKDDVQKVIDTQHEDMMKSRLDQLVTDGKITADQEAKIIAKQAEMKPKMEAARALTDNTARKTAMDAIRTEMQTWEKANNIPTGVMGPGGHGPRGQGNSADAAPPADNGGAPAN